MTIYKKGEWCFVRHGKKQFLAIAPAEDVDKADGLVIAEMILQAVQMSKYHEIEESPKVLH